MLMQFFVQHHGTQQLCEWVIQMMVRQNNCTSTQHGPQCPTYTMETITCSVIYSDNSATKQLHSQWTWATLPYIHDGVMDTITFAGNKPLLTVCVPNLLSTLHCLPMLLCSLAIPIVAETYESLQRKGYKRWAFVNVCTTWTSHIKTRSTLCWFIAWCNNLPRIFSFSGSVSGSIEVAALLPK